MEDERFEQARDLDERGVGAAQSAVGATRNHHATEQLAREPGHKLQALPQPRRALRRLRLSGGIGGRFRDQGRVSKPRQRHDWTRNRAPRLWRAHAEADSQQGR